VNPLEGAATFDVFMFNLWRFAMELYEKLLERPELAPLYKAVLAAELAELKILESELRVRK
jgi:hypothetical protein